VKRKALTSQRFAVHRAQVVDERGEFLRTNFEKMTREMDGDGAAPRGDRGAPDIQRVVRAPAHPYFGPPSNPYFGPPSNPYFGPPSNPYHVPCASLYREPAEGAGESLLPHPPEGGLVLLGGVPDGCCVSWDNLGVRVSSPRGGGSEGRGVSN
jgi:hypothetical protein